MRGAVDQGYVRVPVVGRPARAGRQFVLCLPGPGLAEDRVQFARGRAVQAHAHVPPARHAFTEAGVLVAHVDAAEKGGVAIDHRHLAVVAHVQPVQAAEGGRVEGQAADPGRGQFVEIPGRGVEAADRVVDEGHVHAAVGRVPERPGETGAGGVGADDVELGPDGGRGRIQGREQGREKVAAVGVQGGPVGQGVDGLLRAARAEQGAEAVERAPAPFAPGEFHDRVGGWRPAPVHGGAQARSSSRATHSSWERRAWSRQPRAA